MSDPPEDERSLFVYRRIHPNQWNLKKNRPGRSGFLAVPDKGLSLFRADLRSPRGVMQHAIERATTSFQSTDETERLRGEKQLAQYGQTVEEWLRQGWRVVQLPIAAFAERGYVLDEPDADGHLNAFGDHELHAPDLASKVAVEVPVDAFN